MYTYTCIHAHIILLSFQLSDALAESVRDYNTQYTWYHRLAIPLLGTCGMYRSSIETMFLGCWYNLHYSSIFIKYTTVAIVIAPRFCMYQCIVVVVV